ncbi:MAG: sigma-54-dependent Fis family transcriptional regulator [Ardenticatenales bacterium]|nr:sigma-54-dependent Fis family transcriptional regulator [Ardenticatenales bacterium]
MSDPRRILVVDDDKAIREALQDLLGETYMVDVAGTGAEGIQKVKGQSYDLVLLDLRLPDKDGLTVLQELFSQGVDVPVIVITAHGTSSTAIQAMQAGAYDYLVKPLDLDEVQITVSRLFEHRQLASQVQELQEVLNERSVQERIVGQSPTMQVVFKTIGRVANSDSTVLIMGETGTGKELIADTVQANSRRRRGPFIKVNCAALPETLLESELFGHEKGAFTGAIERRKGHFEMADKGTIFLDEIGEMSLNTQKKLLRILQQGEFQRVGGSATIAVDARVIAATNKNLEQEVASGNFREDLFYRLNVIVIDLPALRERMDDLPLLVAHFLDKYRFNNSRAPSKISEEALQVLLNYHFPGNVRELENSIERAVVLSQGRMIGPEHLILSEHMARDRLINVSELVRQQTPLNEILAQAERMALEDALRMTGSKTPTTAKQLGLSTRELAERAQALGVALP